ncbi:MAG: sensor histidine kinase [Clostridia bacterium]|nr:sensor histidine kinase [Clostridia bacterium]
MKELSLNILDISQNSLKAGAKNVSIVLDEASERNTLILTISDDGCGMSEEMVKNVTDPFCTSRTTRNVGLGIPLLKLAAEQTGGYIEIFSRHKDIYPENHGTVIKAVFKTDSIDNTPLGDIISTLIVIIQGHPEVDYIFKHQKDIGEVSLNTKEMREVLGEEISLADFEILDWIKNYLEESYKEIN